MDTNTEGFVLRTATKGDARFLATCLMEEGLLGDHYQKMRFVRT